MKKDGKYRFTLQFSEYQEENQRAGEFLERLGNRKSAVVVAALNEYLENHPELKDGEQRIQVSVTRTGNLCLEEIERMVRNLIEQRIGMFHADDTAQAKEGGEEEKEEMTEDLSLEEDVSQMLDYLDLF